MYNDTALIRMIIDMLAENYNWSYEKAMDIFYNSETCEKISDSRTGLFTCAPIEIVELFSEEYQNMHAVRE